MVELQAAITNSITFEVKQAREKIAWAKDLTTILNFVPKGIQIRYIISSPGPRYVGLYVSGNATEVAGVISEMTGAKFEGKDVATGAAMATKDASGIRWEIYDHPGMEAPVLNDEMVEFGTKFCPIVPKTMSRETNMPDGPDEVS